MTKPEWCIGVVWADGSASGAEHLYFNTEAKAREAFGALKMAMDSDAGSRLSDTPIIITLQDDMDNELKLFGRLIRVLRIHGMARNEETQAARMAEVDFGRAYNEERGRHQFHREHGFHRADDQPEETK